MIMRCLLLSLFFTFSLYASEDIQAQNTSKERPHFIKKISDLCLIRPMLAMTTVIGSTVFILTAPIALLAGNLNETMQVLIKTPVYVTFKRCLGCDLSENTTPTDKSTTSDYAKKAKA